MEGVLLIVVAAVLPRGEELMICVLYILFIVLVSMRGEGIRYVGWLVEIDCYGGAT